MSDSTKVCPKGKNSVNLEQAVATAEAGNLEILKLLLRQDLNGAFDKCKQMHEYLSSITGVQYG